MNTEKLDRLKEVVESYLQKTGISQNDLAKAIGIQSSYLTHLKSRNYNAIPTGAGRTTSFSEAIAKKISIYLKLDTEIWEISNYNMIFNCLYECKKHKEHRIIDGLKGSGKTFTCQMFKKQFPSETYIVTADDDMSPKAFLEELALQMGLSVAGSKRTIRKAIESKIMSQSNTLIIIDESENMKTGSYGAIKALYDAIKDYAGLVLLGANNYSEYLRKQASKNKTPFTQLYSRFSANTVLLSCMSKDDVVMICKMNDILDKEQIRQLIDTCTDYRELDRAIKRIVRDRNLIAS
jgi:DNA transposition AAA+ family ATPase